VPLTVPERSLAAPADPGKFLPPQSDFLAKTY